MSAEPTFCAQCGTQLSRGLLICPTCGATVSSIAGDPPTSAGSTNPASNSLSTGGVPAPPRTAEGANPFTTDLARRLNRLNQWAEAAQVLEVDVPSLPKWGEEAARSATNPEPWAEVVRGVERLAQKKVVLALEDWERRTKGRLSRLEAYSVDSRLERDQIEDVLHSARTGDLSQALATFQQVDRVLALKERHLDQAREELERVVALLRDMAALGLSPPQDPNEIAEDLERELRGGRLASLKQQIRALRVQTVNRLKIGLPPYITEYGDFLLRERADGVAVELQAAELARGAWEFFKGRPEESLRRLRALAQIHGMGSFRAPRPPGKAGSG